MSTGSLEPACLHASRGHILVVDDDAEMRALLAEVLREAGYDVKDAANGAEALIRLRAESFTAIVLDKNMPGLSGLDLLPGMRVICPETPVVLITAFGDVATYVDAIERGACAYVFKTFRMEELLQTLERALASRRASIPTPAVPGGCHESAR